MKVYRWAQEDNASIYELYDICEESSEVRITAGTLVADEVGDIISVDEVGEIDNMEEFI